MLKKLFIIFVGLIAVFALWLSLSPAGLFPIIIHGPFEIFVQFGAFVLTAAILFAVAALLVFVFAGIGVILLGTFGLVALILTAATIPFLLPLLIPLLILWLILFGLRKARPASTE